MSGLQQDIAPETVNRIAAKLLEFVRTEGIPSQLAIASLKAASEAISESEYARMRLASFAATLRR